VYNSTFTRLFDLGVGAALAWWAVGRSASTTKSRVLSVAGPVALVGLLAGMAMTGDVTGNPLRWMFNGGFLLMAVLAGVVIAAARVEGSVLSRAFAWSPFRLIGRTSYGIYLWHWPVFVLVTTLTVHLSGLSLVMLRLVLVTVLTAASYVWLEQPIRQRRWPIVVRRVLSVVGVVAVIAAVLVGTSLSNFRFPDPRVATAANAPNVPPDGSGDVVGLSSFAWGRANPPTPTHPVSVVSMGDSLPAYAYPGMRAAVNSLAHVHIHNAAVPYFGLTTVSNWRAYFAGVVRQYHPQIVLFTTTWDEGEAFADPARYRQRLDELGAFLKARGVRGLFFEGYPQKHTEQTSTLPASDLQQTNQLWEQTAAAWRNVVTAYVDANPGFSVFMPIDRSVLLNGQVAFWLPPPRHPNAPESTWARVRFIDGRHLCTVGVVRYSAALVYDLAVLLDTDQPTRRWWLGSWVEHPFPAKYASELQGMCPLDHP